MAANGTNGCRLPILRNDTALIKYKKLTIYSFINWVILDVPISLEYGFGTE